MAGKLIIVHGYSDGSTSFTGLADYFIQKRIFSRKDIYFVDYSSMDDDASFRDFADKLNDDYHTIAPDFSPVDVACHSTGALVTRAWLVMHYLRNRKHGMNRPCPVRHLLMFAPANFGSDLAAMGQSFLGKTRTTFFNQHSHKSDFMESGKAILEGLEPASPFQWELSNQDLHGDHGAYFNPANADRHRCYPFVIAAGNSYTGLQARLLKKRAKHGTDGTVRISGTSLNSRKCHFSFDGKTEIEWRENNVKYRNIPFAVLDGFNHGNIVNTGNRSFKRKNGPGELARSALKVETPGDYDRLATRFQSVSRENYKKMPAKYRRQFQQFFFKVIDDVGLPVRDYFIDFYVQNRNGTVNNDLTVEFDDRLETAYYRHTQDGSCRALLLDSGKLAAFLRKLDTGRARLVFDITAASRLPDISFKPGYYVIYEGSRTTGSEPSFLYPNTTTLVEIVLNRLQTDKLLSLSGYP